MNPTRRRPLFTSFEEKAAWLKEEAERLRHRALTSEHSGCWASADKHEAERAKLLRELDTLIDDAMCSIPRHQRG